MRFRSFSVSVPPQDCPFESIIELNMLQQKPEVLIPQAFSHFSGVLRYHGGILHSFAFRQKSLYHVFLFYAERFRAGCENTHSLTSPVRAALTVLFHRTALFHRTIQSHIRKARFFPPFKNKFLRKTGVKLVSPFLFSPYEERFLKNFQKKIKKHLTNVLGSSIIVLAS